MRVVAKQYGEGVLLGWKYNGERTGDTGGGLSSDGYCRVKFDKPVVGGSPSGYNVACKDTTFIPPATSSASDSALDELVWRSYSRGCEPEPEPEPEFEPEPEPEPDFEPEPEPEPERAEDVPGGAFTVIPGRGWSFSDDLQLAKLAKDHPLGEAKPVVAPKCPDCSDKMKWSNYDEDEYEDGWECNECGEHGEGFRWFCEACSNDICGSCKPPPSKGAKSELTLERALEDSTTMERFPRLKGRQAPEVLGRMQCLHNVSLLMKQMLPLIDLVDERGCAKEKWQQLRMVMLSEHKTSTIQAALQAAKKSSSNQPSISIDRTKARWAASGGEDSIFTQIYKVKWRYFLDLSRCPSR